MKYVSFAFLCLTIVCGLSLMVMTRYELFKVGFGAISSAAALVCFAAVVPHAKPPTSGSLSWKKRFHLTTVVLCISGVVFSAIAVYARPIADTQAYLLASVVLSVLVCETADNVFHRISREHAHQAIDSAADKLD
jgi:ABC-type Fe3+-siderophore transport system permease subunit